MKPMIKACLSILLVCGLVAHGTCNHAFAEGIRKPVRAGSFYPADPAELTRLIDRLARRARKSDIRIPPGRALRALVMPHAGYIYSGWTAAHVSLVLKKTQFARVIVLGPDHFIGLRNGAICDVDAYETPLGKVRLDRNVDRLRRQSDLFQSLPPARDREHSLEVVLPFLQHCLGNFRLVPVIVGRAAVRAMASALEPLLDDHTLLVVSSDLSHYLSYEAAVRRDHQTLEWIMEPSAPAPPDLQNRACGIMPLMILRDIANRRHWQPVLLHYSNSGDSAGDRSRVVGYAAIAFFGDNPMANEKSDDSRRQFTEQQGQALVRLARHTIMNKLGCKVPADEARALEAALQDKAFAAHCGTFVTLKKDGQLRGCIGNLTSDASVLDGVRENAINAAFRDPRFAPLAESELDKVQIEVSILTEPRPLEFREARDLVAKLRANVDGVILRQGYASATFLPQVWEQLPQPEDFLGHLCLKAGLSSDAWKQPGLEVLTYQVQYFEENR